MTILALDVGVSAVKAAVLDVATAAPVGPVACLSYALDSPIPDAAEVPAERLWQAVATAGQQAVRQSGVAGKPAADVEGIGISCFTPGLVLLDKQDRPLNPIWTYLDRRARPSARQVWAAVGEEFLATVGNRPLPGAISALCYREQLTADPYLSHRVHSYLHVNGWLALLMTGEKAFDPGNACYTGLFNTMTDQQWSPRWCDYFQVERDWLPPVVDGKTTIGCLRSQVAGELGVPAGIPVKLGITDTSSAILAADMRPGDLLHVVGATQILAVLTARPVASPRRLVQLLGTGPGFLHVTHNPVGGAALAWLRNLCFREQSEEEYYQRTIPQARDRTTRVSLDPPFLAGNLLEIEACRAAFRDLELTTDRLDLVVALLGAIVLRHREALANLGQEGQLQRIFLTGGGAEIVRSLISEYQAADVHTLDEGALRGVAKLFGTGEEREGVGSLFSRPQV